MIHALRFGKDDRQYPAPTVRADGAPPAQAIEAFVAQLQGDLAGRHRVVRGAATKSLDVLAEGVLQQWQREGPTDTRIERHTLAPGDSQRLEVHQDDSTGVLLLRLFGCNGRRQMVVGDDSMRSGLARMLQELVGTVTGQRHAVS